VFKPLSSPTATANYSVFSTGDCSSGGIATAITGTVIETVLITLTTATNTAVTQYLLISDESAAANLNNTIYGLNAGNILRGLFNVAGAIYYIAENKVAINAELTIDGLTSLP
jgi:hypothetical protein